MTERPLDHLIETLSAGAHPVAPLASPRRRSLTALALMVAGGLTAVLLLDTSILPARYRGAQRAWLLIEMALMLGTGLLAVAGAFFAAVPGRSRIWSIAPLPFFVAWILMSCAAMSANKTAWRIGESWHCFLFIAGVSVVLAVPLVRLLSRARPIHPMRVALLAGLGSAAPSVFLLHFFHPFAITSPDVAVHAATVLLVVAFMALIHRRTLRPA